MPTDAAPIGPAPATGAPSAGTAGAGPRRPLPRFADDASRYGHYARMRRERPVERDPESGLWHAYRYAEVQEVLGEHTRFSSRTAFAPRPAPGGPGRGGGPEAAGVAGPPLGSFADSLINMDPPRHTRLRALVSRAFTPRAVAALEGTVAELARDLLNAVAPLGRMDVIADLAGPLPVIVIAGLLGVPASDRPLFKRWSDLLVGADGPDPAAGGAGPGGARAHAQAELVDYFRAAVRDKRRRPGDDVLSALLTAQPDGEDLSDAELFGFCTLLLVAGHETTTNLVGNGFLCLLQHPEAADRLRAEPALVPSAVEEVLRFSSPVQAMFRVAAADTELGGRAIRAGERVAAWIGSANRDESVFAEPERFEPARSPNRHLAFGTGVHFCLGAPLARMEGRIVLGEMLRRLRAPRLDPDEAPEWSPGFVRGVKRFPLRFEAIGG